MMRELVTEPANILNCGKEIERNGNRPEKDDARNALAAPFNSPRNFEGKHGGGCVYLTPCTCTEPCFLQGPFLGVSDSICCAVL